MAQVLSFMDYQNLMLLSLIQTSNWAKEKKKWTDKRRLGYLLKCQGMHFVFRTLINSNNSRRTERW
jgi:hypothetical protein